MLYQPEQLVPYNITSSAADVFLKNAESVVSLLHPENGQIQLVNPRISENWRKTHFRTPTVSILGIFHDWGECGELKEKDYHEVSMKEGNEANTDFVDEIEAWLQTGFYLSSAEIEEQNKLHQTLADLCIEHGGCFEVNDYSIEGTRIYLSQHGLGQMPEDVSKVVIYKFLREG